MTETTTYSYSIGEGEEVIEDRSYGDKRRPFVACEPAEIAVVNGQRDPQEWVRASVTSDAAYDRYWSVNFPWWKLSKAGNTQFGVRQSRRLVHCPHRIRKRLLDLVITIPAILVSLPIIGTLAILIKWIDRGPVFYKQVREGLYGKPIVIWKLRTMYVDAEDRLRQHLVESSEAHEEWERSFKLKNDPRILPRVGHILRRLSLDELPQFLNVLRGDMSLIGPRPLPYYHLEAFDKHFRKLRQNVLPGLSGLWQTNSRSDGDLQDLERLDTYYISNWSVWFDLYLLLKTVATVVVGRGAY